MLPSTETTPSITRPPFTVIAVTMMWCFGACITLMLSIVEQETKYIIIAGVSIVLTVAVLRGYRWMYWVNAIVCSLTFGMSLLQILDPGWYHHPRSILYWRTGMVVVLICLQQMSSCQSWFGIKANRKHRTVYWLIIGTLTSMGQLALPTIRSIISP